MKKCGVFLIGVIGVLLIIIGIVSKTKNAVSFSIIGGADGPTSVFVAGKTASDFSFGMIAIGIIFVAITIWGVRKIKK